MKVETTEIALIEESDLDVLEGVLVDTPIDGSVTVVVKPTDHSRSAAQNRLMWVWHTRHAKWRNDHELDGDNPSNKDLECARFKWAHVLPIFARDGFPAAFKMPEGFDVSIARDALEAHQYSSSEEREKTLRSFAVLYGSTSALSLDQFTEALTEYQQTTEAKGCPLPNGDDLYYQAMGLAR